MTASDSNHNRPPPEDWEREALATHRWGRHGDRALKQHARLQKLWETAQPLDESCRTILADIVALEICNWNMEESILALCAVIGGEDPTTLPVGHSRSMSEERWRKVWAYYLTLRDWLAPDVRNGYETLLKMCDPKGPVQDHILQLLGDRNELKELYVERFCLCLEFWLGGCPGDHPERMKGHRLAVSAVEEEIEKLDPEGQVLSTAFQFEGDGTLNPCHHKLFRRYDIIISSIGAGKWRGAMPIRGTDGFERAATVERYLRPLELWLDPCTESTEQEEDELSCKIMPLLRKLDETKRFLASLLVSLLRAQQLTARQIAESRTTET